ncbi:MAG: GTP-binding protein Sar1 [Exiguobacterium sp.]|jgi:GTP-binding protein SAR1
MSLYDWFWRIASYFGFYAKNAKILFLGLDNAGKTTLLHMLKDDRLTVSCPTQHPNMEELDMGTVKIKAWDLGGHVQTRHVWETYTTDVNGIVFIVDASDRTRISEAQHELNHLLGLDALAGIPFLVLGNKIDMPGCIPGHEMGPLLGISGSEGRKGVRPIGLFMCSVVRRSGYGDGFRWLMEQLD